MQQAVALQLIDDEPSIQAAALSCLKPFKFRYLNEHLEQLLRLADNKTLRTELVMFPVSRGAAGGGPALCLWCPAAAGVPGALWGARRCRRTRSAAGCTAASRCSCAATIALPQP